MRHADSSFLQLQDFALEISHLPDVSEYGDTDRLRAKLTFFIRKVL